MPHPAADTIGFHLVDGASVRPLVKQIWEIDAGSDRDLNGRGEPGVDLHQVRDAGAVASELDFGVTLEVNFPHEPLGRYSDIGRHGDALAQDRLASQGWDRALCPLREAGTHLPIRIQEAHGLASSREQLLEESDSAEARQPGDGTTRFVAGRHELRNDSCSVPATEDP